MRPSMAASAARQFAHLAGEVGGAARQIGDLVAEVAAVAQAVADRLNSAMPVSAASATIAEVTPVELEAEIERTRRARRR